MTSRSAFLRVPVLAACAAAAAVLMLPGPVQGADAVASTERISVAPDGTGGNYHSSNPAVSADGRVVAFQSAASNLVPGPVVQPDVYYRTAPGSPLGRIHVEGESTSSPQVSANGRYLTFGSYSRTTTKSSVHVMDLRTQRTERLAPALAKNWEVSYGRAPVSADGRYVAFVARPTVDEDGDGVLPCRIYVLDRTTGQADRVSKPDDSSKRFHDCYGMSMSADGRKVAYFDGWSNGSDSDGDQGDIVVHDRSTGRDVQADATHDGGPADLSSVQPVISADGSKVAFDSRANNLVPGEDPNRDWNAFVRDLRTGALQRIDGRAPTDVTLAEDLSMNGTKMVVNTADANHTTLGLQLRDLRTGRDTLLAPGVDGKPVTIAAATLSLDGSTVAFYSYHPGLVPDDNNLIGDVFLRHLR